MIAAVSLKSCNLGTKMIDLRVSGEQRVVPVTQVALYGKPFGVARTRDQRQPLR